MNKVALHFRDLGEIQLKNIARPVRVYAVEDEASIPGPSAAAAARSVAPPTPRTRRALLIAAMAIAIAIAGAGSWLWTQRAVTSSGAKSDTKSIAVLPFANMSDDKENSLFFADGIHEDILTNLALIRELRVVSRTSVMQYRDTKKPIRQIGNELGVAYLLEGSVRRAGTKLRVTSQLINAQTDEHVWAKTYDRDLTDVFAIQAALAHDIAGSLQATLSPQEKSFLERRPTENLAAYDLFLQARDADNRDITGLPSMRKREGFLEKAVELDSNFAAAWGELSVVHARYVFYGFDASEARLAKAKVASERSVRLAPDSPDVIRALGTYYYYGYRDYAQAETQYERLARLQPNNPTVYSSVGFIQRRQGQWAESLANLRKAAQLDPGNISLARQVSGMLLFGRRFDEAMAEQRRLIALAPEIAEDAAFLPMFAFWASGSTKEVEEWLARLPAAQFDSPLVRDWRRFWAENRGDYPEFLRLDRLQPYYAASVLNRDRFAQALAAATIYAANADQASARIRLEGYPKELRTRVNQEPANAVLWAELGMIEAVLGRKQEALRSARIAVELIPEARDAVDGPKISNALAFVYAWTGDKDRAIVELTRLLRLPSGLSGLGPPIGVHYMRRSAWFAPLRGDPRYEALLDDPKNNAPLF